MRFILIVGIRWIEGNREYLLKQRIKLISEKIDTLARIRYYSYDLYNTRHVVSVLCFTCGDLGLNAYVSLWKTNHFFLARTL